MKTSVFALSFKRLATVVALSSISLWVTNQNVLASEILDYIVAKLERGEKIIVYGDPLFGHTYTIEGINMTFVAEGCRSNDMCRMIISYGGRVYDPELNVALARACHDQNNQSVICYQYTFK